jgi:FlaA1/EpsC-like NDP-sugar epimerase
LPWVFAIQMIFYFRFHVHQTIWRYVGLWDVLRIGEAAAAGMIVGLAAVLSFRVPEFPRSLFVLDTLLQLSFLSGSRVLRRIAHDLQSTGRGKRILIFGAGDAGEMIVRDMKHNPYQGYSPVGFIDDDPAKIGGRIHGVPVLGSRNSLRSVMMEVAPEEVLIAMPRVPSRTIRDIVRCLEAYRVPIKTLPSLCDQIDGAVNVSKIRNVSLEDLLIRERVGVDGQQVHQLLEGRRVMVTGAGGSIGGELCRQLLALKVQTLVMYERHENSLYLAESKIGAEVRANGIETVVGDVADARRVDETIRKYEVEIIFHAAAHKHVPMMELNPCEAVKNNVRGTRIVLESAIRNHVERFVLVSTDKAVNPSNVMGASKRVAELLVQSAARRTGCKVGAVRFGNVLGSNGSVIPKFLGQIEAGGPVTVTHPAVRRFFMLVPEAVQLILHATAIMEPGLLYILEMGEQIKISDMARHLIRLCGFVPDEDIKIEFTGLRPGEKLFEELVADGEDVEPSAINGVLKVRPTKEFDAERFNESVRELEAAAAANDRPAMFTLLQRLVPTFQSGEALPLEGHERVAGVSGLRRIREQGGGTTVLGGKTSPADTLDARTVAMLSIKS